MITITDKEFHLLSAFIKENYGINLKEEKRTLIMGRLQSELIRKGFSDFSEYYNYIRSDHSGLAVEAFVNKITTNHTFFMREADHFEFFKKVALPYITEIEKKRDLRIWSAGCSSGEEPYTLAMLIDEYLGNDKKLWDAKILATDISSKVLMEGMAGVYSNEKIATLPLSWRNKYFKYYDNDNSVIIDSIRNEVIFRKFNLMDATFPFRKKLDVIFCRNVMIYFDAKTKDELVNKFYDNMEYGGYLFIGHAESLNRNETKFRYIKPAIYRKI